MNTLEKHAPLKKKIVRANHAPYITKNMRKAIMSRSAFYKKGTAGCHKAYKKQKNHCSRLYKKEHEKFNANLCCDSITDNKHFLGHC